MTTSAVALWESPDKVRTDMLASRTQIAEVLPKGYDADRFVRVVVKAIIGNPRLMDCTRTSLLSSVMEAAQLGLEPTGLLGSAYLVPYRKNVTEVDDKGRSVKRSVMVAQLIPGYRGLIDLARRSGEIDSIQADVVRLRDAFDYEPTRQPNPVIHRPFIPNPSDPPEARDRGPIVGVYMLATLRGGFRQPEWMTVDEVDGIRRRSKAADDGPWVTDYAEMARKTVVRRGSKYLPLTTEFRRALELDEEAERDADVPVVPRVSRAAQMLVERASADESGHSAQPAIEQGEVTAEGQNGALSQSSPGGGDGGLSVPTSEPAATTTVPAKGKAKDVTPVVDPRDGEACDVDDVELGQCGKPLGHDGSHASEAGRWPQAKA